MIKEKDGQYDDLSFINSLDERFSNKLVNAEISHEYETFKEIEDKFNLEWQFSKIEGD